MNRVSVSITNFGIQWDDCFVASSIPKALQEQIDEAEATLDDSAPGSYPELEVLNPASPRTRKFPCASFSAFYILDGHHRVTSAKLRGVLVKAVVVGGV